MTRPPRPTPEPHRAEPCDLELLAQFSAGELDAARRDTVSAHLVDCDRCWSELCAQRVAIGAVQTLWEPAPPGLRADLRAAINDAALQPRRAPRRRTLLVAAAVVATLSAGGVLADRLSSTTPHRQTSWAASDPAPIRAAITAYRSTPPSGPAVPAAPPLAAAGFRLTASGSTRAGDITAAQYNYADRHGHRVTVLVSADRAWPRPAPARALSTSAWLITPTTPAPLTIVGGPDRAGEKMLVIASDHTAAMTASAQLGLV